MHTCNKPPSPDAGIFTASTQLITIKALFGAPPDDAVQMFVAATHSSSMAWHLSELAEDNGRYVL